MLIKSIHDLGATLKARRQKLGESQTVFAARIGKPQSWLSQFERAGIEHVYLSTVLDVWARAGLTLSSDLPGAIARSVQAEDWGDNAVDFDDDDAPIKTRD
jgi:transcriptional regulator with XRE-family HTH domain